MKTCPLCTLSEGPKCDVVVLDEAFQGAPRDVVVYSTDHETSLASLEPDRARTLIDVLADRYGALASRDDVGYVFIFEDFARGEGAAHPHAEVRAYPSIPPLPRSELEAGKRHHDRHETCLFCEQVGTERAHGGRVVTENGSFIAYVPATRRFNYEVHIVPRRHATSLLDLSDPERDFMAALLLEVLARLGQVVGSVVEYALSIHQAPTDDGQWLPVSHLHVEICPLHDAPQQLKRFSALEVGAGKAELALTPEEVAEQLRDAG